MSDQREIHIHRLSGCRPTPLAHYLKALGILRLVAEQADPTARGWWEDDVFHLATRLSEPEINAFFQDRYSPTAMTAPWLSRSGYSDDSSHSKTREWLQGLLAADQERFEPFRQCVKQMRGFAEEFGFDLAQPDSMRTPEFVNYVRSRVNSSARLWIDTCIVPGEEKVSYPAIFGTGGNEGSGSYLANYYQALVVALILKEEPIDAVLFEETRGAHAPPAKHRHNAGHYADSTGVDSAWTYILALEGSLLLVSSMSRRLDGNRPNSVAGTSASLASPFAVSNDCVGYASSSAVDSKSNRQGKLVPGRGEQWLPLWASPANLRELQQLFREGRSTIRKRSTSRSRDFCLAIARNGVARGITAFERYGYVQRNGDNHMAVPLGRFEVRQRPHQRLLDEVAPWIDRLRQVASDKLAPQSFARAYRACELAVFNCATRAAGSDFLDLLVAMAAAEDQMLASPKFSGEKCVPIPSPNRGGLSGQWLDVITQNSFEFRLALSLAAQHGPLETKSRWASVRMHWLPLDESGFHFAKGESGLAIGPDQAAGGLDLARASIAVMQRRLLALNRGASESQVPLRLIRDEYGATLNDIQAFLDRRTNDSLILAYARALMAIRFDEHDGTNGTSERNAAPLGGLSLYGVFRLATPTNDLRLPGDSTVKIKCNTALFQRLRNGDIPSAFQLAARQLTNVGLRPKLQVATGTPVQATRLAASLVFGLKATEWTRLALALTDPQLPTVAANEDLVVEAS